MSASVLDQLTLGYRLLWNRRREVGGVELLVDTLPTAPGVDARHLLTLLAELWPARAPQLLLTLSHPALLLDLLMHGRGDGPWITLPASALTDPVLRPRAQQARARGLPLVWPGRLDAAAPPPGRPGLYCLEARQSADLLPPGQILLEPETRAQALAALDAREAWAVAGWPVADTLRTLRSAAARPDRTAISRVVHAIESDASLDRVEALLCAEPVLCFRFMQHINTSISRQRGEIDNVQRGLQVWGLRHVQAWLLDQLVEASGEADLQPVRTGMASRARLVEHLLDPGDEEDLRREVYLCGLYSQLDHLLGEPLAMLLERLPLSQRIHQALLEGDGPYFPALQLTHALEAGDARAVRLLCENYGYNPADVNRALLRTLAGMQS